MTCISTVLIFIVLFLCQLLPAQDPVDSLEIRVLTATEEEKFRTLIHLSTLLLRSDPVRSQTYAIAAVRIAEESGKEVLEAEAYRKYGEILFEQTKFQSAIQYLNQALDIYDRTGELNQAVEVRNILGKVYLRGGDYLLAMDIHLEAKKIAEENGLGSQIVPSLIGIGMVNYFLQNYENALMNLEEGLSSITPDQAADDLYALYNSLALTHDERNEWEDALYYHELALETARKLQHDKQVSYTLNNIGLIYVNHKEYHKALESFEASLELKRKMGDGWGIATTQINLGNTLMLMGRTKRAQAIIREAEVIADAGRLQYLLQNIYEVYADIYHSMGYSDSAFQALKTSIAYRDSIYANESTREMAEMQIKYETEKKEKELMEVREQEKNSSFIRKFLILSVIFTILIAAAIVGIIVARQRIKRALGEKEKQLMESELEKQEILQKELNIEIEHKTKELTTHALNMMHKNKLLSEISSRIDEIMKQADGETHKGLVKLKQQVRGSLKTSKEWEGFRMYFEQVNKDFFTLLHEVNPGLTGTDLKHCALIKLYLNIKETASVLNMSPNSVKSSRNRLKKKLNLKPEESLFDFITRI